MVGADLAGLPAGDGVVAVLDLAEYLLDVLLGIPLLFFRQIECFHALLPDPQDVIMPGGGIFVSAWASRCFPRHANLTGSTVTCPTVTCGLAPDTNRLDFRWGVECSRSRIVRLSRSKSIT